MIGYIFAGPSLPPDIGVTPPGVVRLPPAACGDITRAAACRPLAIGLIDGWFETVLSVWHKEILRAMQTGVHVFGAASMGALRAAELAAFGMQGIGTIFELYRDGVVVADDEVALLHGPQEAGYRGITECLINIRFTTARAVADGIIGGEVGSELIEIARALFYQQRSWPMILRHARARRLPAGQLSRLRAWLPAGRVDQKRADALALLEAMATHLQNDPSPMRVSYHFQHTSMWERARRRMIAPAC